MVNNLLAMANRTYLCHVKIIVSSPMEGWFIFIDLFNLFIDIVVNMAVCKTNQAIHLNCWFSVNAVEHQSNKKQVPQKIVVSWFCPKLSLLIASEVKRVTERLVQPIESCAAATLGHSKVRRTMSSSHEGPGVTDTLSLTAYQQPYCCCCQPISVEKRLKSCLPHSLPSLHMLLWLFCTFYVWFSIFCLTNSSHGHTNAYDYAPMPICSK